VVAATLLPVSLEVVRLMLA
jgi:hypothetical protein